jgi:hypothetical protein
LDPFLDLFWNPFFDMDLRVGRRLKVECLEFWRREVARLLDVGRPNVGRFEIRSLKVGRLEVGRFAVGCMSF